MKVMLFRYRGAHGGGHLVDVTGRHVSFDFLYHDDDFLTGFLQRKCGSSSRTAKDMGLFDCTLDVLGIVVSASDDQQVFQSPRDKNFAVLHKSEVAGPQERPLTGIAENGAEGTRRFFRIAPIALRGAGPGQPNFTDLLRRTTRQRFRMGDDHLRIADRNPTANHLSNRRRVRLGLADHALFQRRRVKRLHRRRDTLPLQGNQQRVFRHPVSRGKRLAAKSRRSKRIDESIDGIRRNGFRSAARHFPPREVQLRAILRRDNLHTVTIGKVGTAAVRNVVSLNGFKPAQRTFQECERGHHIGWPSDPGGLDDALHQPIIVKMRHPG